MPLLRKRALRSPTFIFVAYVALGCLALLLFRAIFPGEGPPLPIMARGWRMTRWFMDVVAWFPALALSALVVPFGLCMYDARHSGVSGGSRFSVDLFKKCFATPVITAICAASLYALLFFLALPLAQNQERNMRLDGEVYRAAWERAREHGARGEWLAASQFLAVADSIWEDEGRPIDGESLDAEINWADSPYLARMRSEVAINLDRERFARPPERPTPPPPTIANLPGRWEPLTAPEAWGMSQTAYVEGRLFDAHWLATLSQRLAPVGSYESTRAARFAADTWNLIQNQQPTDAAQRARDLYQLKRDGYNAMILGNYERAYFLLREHARLAPRNTDVENFIELSERGLAGVAFFLDETRARMAAGDRFSDVIFSLPTERGGRAVLRLEGLSATADAAFAENLEYMRFDAMSRLELHVRSPFAKLRPFPMEGPEARPQVLVLMRALDRHDGDARWEPIVERIAVDDVRNPGAQLTLDVSYGDFLMLARMGRDVSAMHLVELFDASALSLEAGHVPQVFQAEILNRLGSGLFLLPAAIAAIAAAWFFRARRFPRVFFLPLLVVLPLVFNAMSHLVRAGFNVIGISLTLTVGFPLALVLFSAILAMSFLGSMFLLAAQRG